MFQQIPNTNANRCYAHNNDNGEYRTVRTRTWLYSMHAIKLCAVEEIHNAIKNMKFDYRFCKTKQKKISVKEISYQVKKNMHCVLYTYNMREIHNT